LLGSQRNPSGIEAPSGQGTAGQSKEDELRNIRATLRPEKRAVKVDSPSIVGPGQFEATIYPGERYRVGLESGPGCSYDIKQLSHNGAAQAESSAFTASQGSLCRMTLLLDRGGSVEAHVNLDTGANRPMNMPYMVLVKDGMRFAEFQGHDQVLTRPDASGVTFTFWNLAPGRYRAIVLPDSLPTVGEYTFQEAMTDSSRASTTGSWRRGRRRRLIST